MRNEKKIDVSKILAGDRSTLAKAISVMENDEDDASEILKKIYHKTGRAYVIGITGPPGTGKSTVINQLVSFYKARGKQVGVLAVDPSSPLSGGALLGDRVRMLTHSLDPSVFIRSMASRGDVGGLSRATRDAVRLLDAAGMDVIIVETVGIGQAEVEIITVADVVVVILMPELGDEVQAIKSGVTEIADIFVVNKADLGNADKILLNLERFRYDRNGRKQGVLRMVAKTGEGIGELVKMLDEYRNFLQSSQKRIERERRDIEVEIMKIVERAVIGKVQSKLMKDSTLDSVVSEVVRKELDPRSAARVLLKQLGWDEHGE